ncbi:polysaccharide deacetylase family protein [Paenibacillus lentus]|uniref:Polysaccharide deacetylase family protein n=1 Tax=Paenibacillus lentus TaxID=1338368 RepID=A0A3Q8S5D2_9BACL|nr:polysaccharide deacetylase family protein [Paenibacillus lentus]AZK47419.1 polysaccharide deacetylase family protein [Paenibacillus lentus]
MFNSIKAPLVLAICMALHMGMASVSATPVPSHDTTSSEQSVATEARPMTLGELHSKYSETFKFSGPHVKQIALTFDDVPDPRFTPKVLDILKQHGVKATFFVVGNRAKKHPELLKRIHREGHIVGNHSYSHPLFKKKSALDFKNEIRRAEKIIEKIVGYKPRFIRPPYGEINEEQLKWAKQQGYKIINWNVDSLDWKALDKEKVKHNVLSAVGPGAIVLQHAGGGVGSNLSGTVEALPDIIRILRNRGYCFVTISELLHQEKAL